MPKVNALELSDVLLRVSRCLPPPWNPDPALGGFETDHRAPLRFIRVDWKPASVAFSVIATDSYRAVCLNVPAVTTGEGEATRPFLIPQDKAQDLVEVLRVAGDLVQIEDGEIRTLGRQPDDPPADDPLGVTLPRVLFRATNPKLVGDWQLPEFPDVTGLYVETVDAAVVRVRISAESALKLWNAIHTPRETFPDRRGRLLITRRVAIFASERSLWVGVAGDGVEIEGVGVDDEWLYSVDLAYFRLGLSLVRISADGRTAGPVAIIATPPPGPDAPQARPLVLRGTADGFYLFAPRAKP